jgi:hypothetical protein
MNRIAALAALAVTTAVAPAQPLTTAFTYQGQLANAGSPATGAYDFKFTLYDAASGGAQVGPQLCSDNVSVNGGLVTVQLDFGSQFAGQQRFIETWVRPHNGLGCGSNGGFSILAPRQPLTSAPNSDFALTAASAATATTATNATQLNSQPASFYTNAANLASGTLPDARLALTVARLNTSQTFSAAQAFSAAPSFTSAGAPFSVSSTTVVTNLNADLLDGLSSSAFLQSIPVPLNLTGTNGGGVIKGSNSGTGAAVMGVQGEATSAGATGTSYGGFFTAVDGIGVGVLGRSAGVNGAGVFGQATASTGANYGVHGVSSSPTGYGVYGEDTATSGTPYGVYGLTHAPFSYGVYGECTDHNGAGVYGVSSNATAFSSVGVLGSSNTTPYGYGVYGTSPSYGVFGYTEGAGGIGVYGETTDPSGRGVIGWAFTGSGNAYGVWGQSDSTSGRGVFGNAGNPSGTTYGGRFEADSTAGRAVYGLGNATGASDAPYGVRGQVSTATAGFAVYAVGDMGASGVKPFRIDHPQDPANKYLLHYAAESPEVLNIYRGTVTLDGAGEATVDLPPYFASINKSPSYQLTAVGAPMPLLHVAKEISDEDLAQGEKARPGEPLPACSFRIAGGAPNAKVSWEVKALRNDLRIRLHGAPVERDKTGLEQGRYQHPEYYGLPGDLGMDDASRPELPKPIPPGPPPAR